jgi:lipoprotein-releasing system permease protein
MVLAGNRNKVVVIRGVEQNKVGQVSGLNEKLVLGSLTFQDTSGTQGIIIGLTLADRLGKVVGDEIQIMSPQGFQSSLTSIVPPQAIRFRVTGIYESNNKDYDANYAFISLESAQQLFEMEGRYNGLEIRLYDFHDAEKVKGGLGKRLQQDIEISTWYDLHKSLYNVMKIERWSAYLLISLIILVATFNLLGALTMGVVEKRRDIGVLKSMGLSTRKIIRLFMTEGIIIGIIGTVLGIGIGLFVLYLQTKYTLFPLDPTIYIIPAIPVKIQWTDFIAVAVSSLGLSYLASYYPARRAGLTSPAESLRWE